MQRAFSLVELSIVLVILGLLTGGILAGQSLIRAAELRSISADLNRYTTAANTFRDKYFALPGDMRNAVKFWTAQAGGLADDVDATCQALDNGNPATGQATCNGNGDGRIGVGYGNIAGAAQAEIFRAWQHLANAGLVEGSFAGVTDSTINAWATGPVTRAGFNMPASRINGGIFMMAFWESNPDPTGTAVKFGDYGNIMLFGAQGCTGMVFHCFGYRPIIQPEEAWNLDTKMDDGQPGTGKVMPAGTVINAGCSNNDTTAATYRLDTKGNNCGLIFKTGL